MRWTEYVVAMLLFSGVSMVVLYLIERMQKWGAAALLRRNLLLYGVGGIIAPFIGIKVIDVLLTYLRFV